MVGWLYVTLLTIFHPLSSLLPFTCLHGCRVHTAAKFDPTCLSGSVLVELNRPWWFACAFVRACVCVRVRCHASSCVTLHCQGGSSSNSSNRPTDQSNLLPCQEHTVQLQYPPALPPPPVPIRRPRTTPQRHRRENAHNECVVERIILGTR